MDRKLASIQIIEQIDNIPGADKIGLAKVLGWHVIVRKDEFKPGDKCIYFEYDSVLPEWNGFEFLRRSKFRVKTIKMKGVISQGLAVPFSLFETPFMIEFSDGTGGCIIGIKTLNDLAVGSDVTGLLCVKKFEIEDNFSGSAAERAGRFPAFIPQTDETRIQTVPELLNRHRGKMLYASEKIDGTSFTAYKFNNEFHVCSRKEEKSATDGAYAEVAKAYHLADVLPEGYCIQAELLGPKIQGNKYKLPGYDIYVFNVYKIRDQKYMDLADAQQFIWAMGLKFVPVVNDFPLIDTITVDMLTEMSKGHSVLNPDIPREGIVIRGETEDFDLETGRLSFKVINPEFLLKFVGEPGQHNFFP